jgi:hypothetical protein
MATANAHLMSRSTDGATPSSPVKDSARTWSSAFGDAVSFALVGIAAVGFVVESLDVNTDNLSGVLQVAAGAGTGVLASAVYGRLEANADRLAKVRVLAWSVVRFFVAFELVRYGVAKLVGMQFYPRYYRLDTRAADLSPMALAWTFFGRSYAYQAITGVIEVAAALLLCFRRTAALGACVLLPLMANIVLVNLFYDVPVKLFSSIYLVMAAYLLSPEARRLWMFFLEDGAVPPRTDLGPTAPSAFRRVATAFVIALVLILPGADILHKAFQRGLFRSDPLEGAWTVEGQVGLGIAQTAKGTWEKLYFEKGAYGFVRVNGERVPFKTDVDERARTLRLFDIGDAATVVGSSDRELTASYRLDGRRLYIEGAGDGAPFAIDLVRDLPR